MDLSKLNPEELIKAYIESKGETIDIVPEHATNTAIGALEEILYFLKIEPYPEGEEQKKGEAL